MARVNGKRFMGIPDEFWISFVIMVGFFLKLVYDSKLGFQAGSLSPGNWEVISGDNLKGGHIEVIHYLFQFHHLPDVSPVGLAGYADPPFFYIICSLILELFHRLMGWSISVSLKFLLAFNVIYVMVGECCGIGILQKFGVRGRKLVVGILFLIFFPTFYNLCGSLDGSAMSFMFSMLTLNSALSWFGSRRKKVLTRTAIELGLGLMTSFACFAVIPVLIVLFYHAVKDGRRNQTPLRIQYRRFGIVTGVMGLIWPLYLVIRFHLPPFYVEPSGVRITAPALARLAAPGRAELTHLHTVGTAALESNIWAQTFKTAVVDFHAINITATGTRLITLFLLYLCIALCIAANLMSFYTVFAAGRIDKAHRDFVFVGYMTMLAGYIGACIAVPYTGTMNFKSIAPILIFPLIGMSVCGSGDMSDNIFEKVMTGIVNALVLVLAFMTAFLFGFYV